MNPGVVTKVLSKDALRALTLAVSLLLAQCAVALHHHDGTHHEEPDSCELCQAAERLAPPGFELDRPLVRPDQCIEVKTVATIPARSVSVYSRPPGRAPPR